MHWMFEFAYYKTIFKICQRFKYNIELEEQRKLELKLKAEQNKAKETSVKEAEDEKKKSTINEITQEVTIKKIASEVPMKASMTAISNCRNPYYKRLSVKMHYKELNQSAKDRIRD